MGSSGDSGRGSPSIFDRCRRPSDYYRDHPTSPVGDDAAPCGYLLPKRVLNPRGPDPHPLAIRHEKELLRSYEDSNVVWGVFSFQVASADFDLVGGGDGGVVPSPNLGMAGIAKRFMEMNNSGKNGTVTTKVHGEDYSPPASLERYLALASRVRSVTFLAAPKCASRSLRELFTRRIAAPTRIIPGSAGAASQQAADAGEGNAQRKRSAMASQRVTPEFAERLERAQREDGIVPAGSGEASQLASFVRSLWDPPPLLCYFFPFLQEPRQQRRRDIVLSVVRNPVRRFFSSVTQLLSMRGTRGCWGCASYLEPCLRPSRSRRKKARWASPNDSGGRGNGDDNEGEDELEPIGILRCLVRSIEAHGFWNEHLIPWVHFVRTPLAGRDVEVAVFSMDGMGELAAEFGAAEGQEGLDPFSSSSFLAAANGTGGIPQGVGQGGTTVGLHLNKFDEGKVMTEGGEELRGIADRIRCLSLAEEDSGGMTMPQDLMEDVCRLYAVDVAVIRHLGFRVGTCK